MTPQPHEFAAPPHESPPRPHETVTGILVATCFDAGENELIACQQAGPEALEVLALADRFGAQELLVRRARVLSAATHRRLFLVRFSGREELAELPPPEAYRRPYRIDRLYALLSVWEGIEGLPHCAVQLRSGGMLHTPAIGAQCRVGELERHAGGALDQLRQSGCGFSYARFGHRETVQVIDERERR